MLAGCGESTNTVSNSSPPPSSAHAAAKSSSTPTRGGAKMPAGGSGETAPAASGSQTRTAPEPAFAEEEGKGSQSATEGEGLRAALAVVRAHGFRVEDTSDYHPNQTLRVLIGTGASSGDGYDKQAFFFVDDRYIGTDASSPSAQVGVVSQGDTEVTLSYALYRPGDPMCCPGGGEAKVRFQLNNGKLTALEQIPPVHSSTGSSRL
jgi:LppP/LprE lipoprotein